MSSGKTKACAALLNGLVTLNSATAMVGWLGGRTTGKTEMRMDAGPTAPRNLVWVFATLQLCERST
jgi:hypothetical protein